MIFSLIIVLQQKVHQVQYVFLSLCALWSHAPKLSPIKTLYEALSNQKRKSSNSFVYVFWDRMCRNIGQNWEKSFVQELTNSHIIILLVSSKALQGIKYNAPLTQDNVLVEYQPSSL